VALLLRVREDPDDEDEDEVEVLGLADFLDGGAFFVRSLSVDSEGSNEGLALGIFKVRRRPDMVCKER
jgi:hypothetical protein